MSATEMVHEVMNLVSKYGIDNIRKTLDFLVAIEFADTRIIVQNASGEKIAQLTPYQYNKLSEKYGSVITANKIEAIKELRNMTGLALKDAKEGVEFLFQRVMR